MSKVLVVLPGWIGVEKDLQGIKDSAPQDTKILMVDYKKILSFGYLDKFNENFLKYLEKNVSSKCILVGVSLGGIFAVKFAYSHPEKVEKLILVDPEGIGRKNPTRELFNLVRSRILQRREKAILSLDSIGEFFRELLLQISLGLYACTECILSDLKSISVPLTFIWGEKDCVTSLADGRKMHEAAPNSKFVVLKGLGHDWIAYSPKHFWANIT
ncbi:hypothetical protein A2617_03540 [Candidatus Daviesbacteria bacterium RIFOXYD1_FULL_41_10]|uniref:Serine aminopeptidase S33 domain-containing protein n=1 Tax=Candidatus Daviesbacteria bacterium RIFOXYD1_FULL_41_10 TaxID=1797801 RepID=A0A1F5N0T4_9BACT|nr:MAG: hypothetical protein A2617_03540 [Candidatus Daviesbacteria bacterium RIFOXYD1_FULL_41_10]